VNIFSLALPSFNEADLWFVVEYLFDLVSLNACLNASLSTISLSQIVPFRRMPSLSSCDQDLFVVGKDPAKCILRCGRRLALRPLQIFVQHRSDALHYIINLRAGGDFVFL